MEKPGKESKKKYLYGIIRKPKAFEGKLSGIEGQNVNLINFKGLAAVVSDVEKASDEQSLIKRDNIFAHERIIDNFMRKSEVILPVSFGTLAENDQVLLKDVLQDNYRLLEETIRRLEGKVEVNIKAVWKDLKPVVQEIVKENPQLQAQKKKNVLSLQEIIEVGKVVSDQVQLFRETLRDQCLFSLKESYVSVKELPIMEDEMIFNLALLVPKKKKDQIREGFIQFDEKLRNKNVIFQYTEPMAPYNFVDLLIQL